MNSMEGNQKWNKIDQRDEVSHEGLWIQRGMLEK
jgi:hypothetical protein